MKKVELKFKIPAFLITAFVPILLLWRRLRRGYAFRRIPVNCASKILVQALGQLQRYRLLALIV